jgi:stage II sporulation protein P
MKLQSVLEGSHPGLCRSIDLRTERFNQHATPGSILVEVGSHGNTLPQALASAELLGEGLAAMIHTLQANNGTLKSLP